MENRICSTNVSFEEILKDISDVVVAYRSDQYLDEGRLKDMHRKLSTALYFLNEHRDAYKRERDQAYHECKESSVAAKDRYADRVVPELYQTRVLYEAGQNVLMSMSINLKY